MAVIENIALGMALIIGAGTVGISVVAMWGLSKEEEDSDGKRQG